MRHIQDFGIAKVTPLLAYKNFTPHTPPVATHRFNGGACVVEQRSA